MLGAFALIAGFSVGLLYTPAAILMLLAACVGGDTRTMGQFPIILHGNWPCWLPATGQWKGVHLSDDFAACT